ncbi:MAG: hypothetical protein NTX82_05140 [Candidatus Parcubacteria bacterium]|nr:hypothetical protein [Candidatus Parcubacteria bacterium]
MGTNGYPISEVGYVETKGHYKRIAGKCPMCAKEFDITFDLQNGQTDYECVCGYFRFDAENDRFTEDNHNISKEDWVQRRQEKETKENDEDPKVHGLRSEKTEGWTCDNCIFDPRLLCTDMKHGLCKEDQARCGDTNDEEDFKRCRHVRITIIFEEVPEE